LKTALDQVASGYFNPHEPGQFADFVETLINHDRFKLLADFQSYIDCQARVSETFRVSDLPSEENL